MLDQEQGARNKEQGTRNKEQGTRNKEQGANESCLAPCSLLLEPKFRKPILAQGYSRSQKNVLS